MEAWEDDADAEGEEGLRDFAYGGKDALIFLVDASKPMREKSKEEQDPSSATCLQMALRAVEAHLKRAVFASPNDLVGVLLYGTEKKVGVRDFDRVSLLLPLEPPEARSVLRLEEMRRGLAGEEVAEEDDFDKTFGSAEEGQFSLHEALWQCQALFSEVTGKVARRCVTLLTCVDEPHKGEAGKERQAMQKAGDLHDTGVRLDVLPLQSSKGGRFDASRFFKGLVQLADDDDAAAAEAEADPAERYEELIRTMRRRVHKKRSVGKMHLDFGNGVRIGISTYNLVQRAYKPTKVKLARDTNEEVKVQRTFVNHRTGAPLLPSDMNKFQEYGGRRIKFTLDEVKGMTALDGKTGLRLCGFKPISSLKWGHFVRSGGFLYPEEKLVRGSRNMFAALLIKCSERSVAAVCSYKPREASAPSFVALVPQEEKRDPDTGRQDRPAGFSLVYLPFSDDLRTVPENAKLVEPDPEQVGAARKVIRKLRMRDYAPDAFENPDLQCHYGLVESLALQRDEVERPEDTTMPDEGKMRERLKDAAGEFVEAVYPPGYDPSAPATKRKAAAAPSAKREPAKKRAKAEEGDSSADRDSLDMGSYASSKTVQKLTVAQLRGYLGSSGVATAGMKKAQLVEEVYNLFDTKG